MDLVRSSMTFSYIKLTSMFLLLVPSLLAQGQAQSIEADKTHVLVLGTFHLANHNKDMFNVQADDMLAPKRQAEIAAFVESLKAFHPTKIAVEAAAGQPELNQKYRQYLAGKYTLTADEIDQIGFRLAKELGHTQLYPINVMADFPFEAVQDFAKKNGKQELLNQTLEQGPKQVEKISDTLKNGTVGDVLRYMNQAEEIRKDQAFYMTFARFAGNGEYPGPDLLTAWYGRNIRIFSNLRNVIDTPADRVLVIYGAGHAYWLERDVLDSDDLTLDRLADYVH
jgi:hypothetical protein